MDNLSYVIEMSILSTYAYDTQIFYTANELSKVEETISNDKCGIYYYIHGIYGLCEKEQFKTSGNGVGKKQRTDQPVLKCG